VTGARRGSGKAIALKLARDGVDLAIADMVISDELSLVANEITQIGSSVDIVTGDISDVTQHDMFLNKAEEKLGPIDCLVNNAGVSVLARSDLLDVTPEAYDYCLDINTRGTCFC
jgi:NAD(P)-dependent dehydrogenase (short-subunit alcohol dehydrogenase family)